MQKYSEKSREIFEKFRASPIIEKECYTNNYLKFCLFSFIFLFFSGKGMVHVSFVYKKVSSCVLHFVKLIRRGIAYIKRKIASCFQTIFGVRSEPFDVQRQLLIQEFT